MKRTISSLWCYMLTKELLMVMMVNHSEYKSQSCNEDDMDDGNDSNKDCGDEDDDDDYTVKCFYTNLSSLCPSQVCPLALTGSRCFSLCNPVLQSFSH